MEHQRFGMGLPGGLQAAFQVGGRGGRDGGIQGEDEDLGGLLLCRCGRGEKQEDEKDTPKDEFAEHGCLLQGCMGWTGAACGGILIIA